MHTAVTQLTEHIGTSEPATSLPPPGFNWELRTETIGGVIAEHHTTLSAAIKGQPWEFVAAVALNRIREAVRAFQKEPIGITGTPTLSARTNQLVSTAQWWLRRALLERRQQDVYARARLQEGQRQGVEGSARQEERLARHKAILDEGMKLKRGNASLSINSIAKMLNARHENETGWKVRTITQVLRDSRI